VRGAVLTTEAGVVTCINFTLKQCLNRSRMPERAAIFLDKGYISYFHSVATNMLRSALDWRIFIGKVEDFISYRIESCSCR
jgi:hypothetical protein